MDRRLFLSGMLGLAGSAALLSLAKPGQALAGVHPGGILDELDDRPLADGSDSATVEEAQYDPYYRRRRPPPRRRRRRRVWRTVCRRYWRHGRWRRRCYRRPVWVWYY
ncbi:protamine-2 (modular protein) [Mesorhizobium sp. SP-1A]|uniref:protamine-2 (modular protein) n=1 Tax=Mesorhizobium sp. SP-1A TaxID=3077840 RepID=UPI0028F713D2|nr:protamine-2 (modular protein) [Mesorhizobium sp. SP-1A]